MLATALGSTSVTANSSGQQTAQQTYYPYGAVRTGSLPTDYSFTGQKLDTSASLLYYGARYYAADIGRFAQPDSIIPNLYNPQSLNRYTYANNNPVRYVDPTGHDGWDLGNAANEFAFGFVSEIVANQLWFVPQAREALAANPSEPVLRTGGRVVGDVAAGALSLWEGDMGLVGMGGGAIGVGTGVLSVAGAPAVAVGVALEGQAIGSGVSAATNFGGNLSMFAKKAAKGEPNPELTGAKGTQGNEQYWKGMHGKNETWLDVENYSPGYREGQIHFQEKISPTESYKWYYDIRKKIFLPEKGTNIDPPNYLKELLENDEKFRDALDKALRFLGEE